MVTYCATKLTATCSPMIGQSVDTKILPSTGTNPKSWKVLETVFSILNYIKAQKKIYNVKEMSLVLNSLTRLLLVHFESFTFDGTFSF